MDDRFQLTVNGQEVGTADINLIATSAALADDHVFQELFRLGAGAKGVTCASGNVSAIIQPSGSADATVKINPFRAFIGPLSATTAQAAYKDGRSAVMGNAVSTTATTIQFPAAAANNRWDLVYARVDVDIDGDSVSRYVKTSTSPATQTTVVRTKKTTVTIGRVAGAEATTPVKPSLPADSVSSYYISLAYVLLPSTHTLTTAIAAANIDENAPVIRVSFATGVASMRVANANSSETGLAITNETWTPASGRPKAFLPLTMTGLEGLQLVLRESATPRTVPLNTTGAVVDNSVDWRKRKFKVTVGVSASADPAWVAGGNVNKFPDGRANSYRSPSSVMVALGQSFQPNDAAGAASKAALFQMTGDGSTVMANGSTILLYVDLATGQMKCDIGATSPACDFDFWIEATGQFNNCF